MMLTTEQAREQKYSEAFISYPALGDQILMLYAAREFHKLTGTKALIGTTYPELFVGNEFCDVLEGLNVSTLTGKLPEMDRAGIRVYPVTYYQSYKTPDGTLRFSFPAVHLIAEMVARMGASGLVAIDPVFELADAEKRNWRLCPGVQIAIISHGKDARKSWGVSNMQALVNHFQGVYNFVQLGSPDDLPLHGVLDKRGIFSLREVAAVLRSSDLFIGGIGALMHLARGVDCPAVITYSSSEPLCSDSYACNMNIMPRNGCSLCQIDLINAGDCVKNFNCVRAIKAEDVYEAVAMMLLQGKRRSLQTESFAVRGNKKPNFTALTARIFQNTCSARQF